MAKIENAENVRSEINLLIHELCLQTGWRQHFAKALKVHPSSINNAINGSRSGPREINLLNVLHKYLIGLNRYYQNCAPVNTKIM